MCSIPGGHKLQVDELALYLLLGGRVCYLNYPGLPGST